MKALLVYPQFPTTFWGFDHALSFISKKATQPPLGLLTVAAMLPEGWERRLVDMNVSALKNKDLEWADVVFISAMSIQKKSTSEVIARCRKAGVRTVAGGPLFTTDYDAFSDVDHLVLNEAEITLPMFLEDFQKGDAGRIYASKEFADIRQTPAPQLDLADFKRYVQMSIQYSRGCPFDCEFCDISVLYGRKVRTKSAQQIVKELDSLYRSGWRGDVFFVDDNFIGNATKLKREILPVIIGWMKKTGQPFTFQTQASINLADDEELLQMMVLAGFDSVFVGIETTNEDSLVECGKFQNTSRDLAECVKAIQKAGLHVTAGFILGFDHDPPSIFENISAFIRRTEIIAPMIGLLNAPRHTRLHRRLQEEGRLLKEATGDNTDMSMNFVPAMDSATLIAGYKKLVQSVFSPGIYYERVIRYLRRYRPPQRRPSRITFSHVGALVKSMLRLGVLGKERVYYWKLFFWTLLTRPSLFPLAVTFAIYGYHFRRVFNA